MLSGDELYFYISATDNNKQEARSDIYSIKIEDTATLMMSMDGMISGIDLKPEFFRSQRQIIIETEKLLKDKNTLTTEAFNNKSNELGMDQKLLRLRYGKFLGEEAETNIGEEPDAAHDDHDHDEANKPGEKADGEIAIEDFNNADKLIDQIAHKHDIAEDATFFDPETKSALKATLAEMWKAELRLRTHKPSDALPFEYKALRLLKELQQKSREYVAKTNTHTTPLKPAEKRLTGELDKVIGSSRKIKLPPTASPVMALRKAIGVLARLRDKNQLHIDEWEILDQSLVQLTIKASEDPATYLASLEAMKGILQKTHSEQDITRVEKALQKLIKIPAAAPAAGKISPDMNLSTDYFFYLRKQGRRS
jgi:hypothetical protein